MECLHGILMNHLKDCLWMSEILEEQMTERILDSDGFDEIYIDTGLPNDNWGIGPKALMVIHPIDLKF